MCVVFEMEEEKEEEEEEVVFLLLFVGILFYLVYRDGL